MAQPFPKDKISRRMLRNDAQVALVQEAMRAGGIYGLSEWCSGAWNLQNGSPRHSGTSGGCPQTAEECLCHCHDIVGAK